MQGDGTIYAGGEFTTVNVGFGQAANRAGLAAFNSTGFADGSWNPNPGNPQSGTPRIDSLATFGSGALAVIYAGGNFNTMGGQTRRSLAKISDSGTVDGSWNPDIPGPASVNRIVASSDGQTVYAAGFFQTVGATSRDSLVALSSSGAGTPTAFHPIVGGAAYGLGLSNDGSKLAVGGWFSAAGPQLVRRNNLAAIDIATGQPTSWAPYTDDTVNAVAVLNSNVYVGGAFRQVTDTDHLTTPPLSDRVGIAAFRTDTGGADAGDLLPWNAEIETGQVNAIAVGGSTVYVGGTFTTLEADCSGGLDVTRNHLAAFDEVSCPLDWNPDVDNAVQSLAVSGGSVYAGGKFSTVGGSPRNHLAGISIAGGQPTNFDPNVNGEVDALAASGTTLFAGGSFSQVNGTTTRLSAAAFEIGSGGAGEFGVGAATPWDPQVAGTVNALAVSGQNVYVGGNFASIGPCPVCQQGSAGAVTASSGAVLPSWLPEPNANVYAIALGPNNVVLGGDFTAVGYPRHGSPFASPEPNAVVRGGFAPFNGLPEPPANVAASPRDGGATVTFGTSPFTGGSAISQYKVTASPGGQVVTGSSSPIVVNGLTNNTQYTFTVSATNGVGEGAPSLPTSPVTPMPAPSVPGKPTDVTGTAGDGQVDVAFTAPSNGNSPITGYTVTVSPGGRQVQGNGSPITVTGLTNGQPYTFTVMATNGIGDGPTSDPSGAVTPRGDPRRGDQRRRDVRQRAGDGEVRRSPGERLGDHRLPGRLVARGPRRHRNHNGDRRPRPAQRDELHVHGHRHERDRGRAGLCSLERCHPAHDSRTADERRRRAR